MAGAQKEFPDHPEEFMRRILWLNPIAHSDHDPIMEEMFQREALPDTEVMVKSLTHGPWHLGYHYYGTLVLPESIAIFLNAEREGYDAAVMGCFYDPGVREIREVLTTMPIVFPEETCTHLAATMGDKFSILVAEKKCIPAMSDNLERYGLSKKLASFVSLDMNVLEFQKDPAVTQSRMMAAGKQALDEGAEVLIFGCTMEYGFAPKMQDTLGVPVIDAAITSFKYAEFRADLRQRYGWSHSKRCAYESPKNEEIKVWGLDKNAFDTQII
jgi:allantoin racemase